MKLKTINNTDVTVEEKVNYFIDCINNYVRFAGASPEFEIENPLSLVEKIIYQLSESNDLRLEYLDNFFSNSLLAENSFLDEFETYAPIKNDIKKYQTLRKNEKEEKKKIIDSAKFQKGLAQFQHELKNKFVVNVVESIFKLFTCGHKLYENEHNLMIESYANLLASEYFFRYRNKSEIFSIISNVFKRDLNTFPFPPNIKTKRQRIDYLKAKDLKNQVFGLYYEALKKPERDVILVKIFGAHLPHSFVFKYNLVSFWGIEHERFNKIRNKIKGQLTEDFFQDDNCIIAEVEVDSFSNDSLLEQAFDKIKNELRYLSAIFNRDLSIDNTQNYILTNRAMEFKGGGWSSRKYSSEINESTIERLRDNPYYILKRTNSDAKNWFLANEHIFVDAHSNRNIPQYWHYLETLLSYNNKKIAIRDRVSSILLLNEENYKRKRVAWALKNSLNWFNGGHEILKVSFEDLKKVHKTLSLGKLPLAIRNSNYPFIQKLVKEFDSPYTAKEYLALKQYYNGVLLETYELRNFYVHRGIYNEKSMIKLKHSLPHIIIGLRQELFTEIKNNSHSSFEYLIQEVAERADRLLK